MPILADSHTLDGPTTERARALAGFGFIERQARFLVTVMLHSGVFVGRQYASHAGITYGQKVHDFVEKLLARRLATAMRFGPTGRLRVFHVQHKALYGAIGEPDNRHRRPVRIGRAIERLMVLDAVLADRDLVWLGTERDKYRHFIQHLGTRVAVREFPHVVFGTSPHTTTRYFPDKLPIGVDPSGQRHVFLYLATRRSPMPFRLFLLRHAEFFAAVGFWTLRILFPEPLAAYMTLYRRAAVEQLARPLRLSERDALGVLFRQRQTASTPAAAVPAEDWIWTREAAATPAFRALYRRWRDVGDPALWLASSSVLRDALERGEARIECVVLPHPYGHFAEPAGTV